MATRQRPVPSFGATSITAAIAAASAVSSNALAQQAAEPATPQTVNVTAQRPREASDTPVKGYKADGTSLLGFELELQQAPATVNVLTSDFLRDAGVRGLTPALNLIPGVTIGDNGGSPHDGILIRGYAANPTVNGIPQAVTTRPKFSTLNIERIEVIKGVSGVEGNVDDFGGTLDIVTRKPQRTAAIGVLAGLGDFGYKQLAVDATGPLALGGALQYRLIGGWTQGAEWRPGRPDHNPRVEIHPSLNWDYAPGSNVLLETGFVRINDPLDRGGLYIEGAGFRDNLTPRNWSMHQSTDYQRQSFGDAGLTWNHRLDDTWAFKLNAQATRNQEPTRGFRNGDTEGSFLFADDGVTWNGVGVDIPIFLDVSNNEYRTHGWNAQLRGRFDVASVVHTLKLQASGSHGSNVYATGGTSDVPLGFYPVVDNTVNLFGSANNQSANIIGLDGPYYPYFRETTDKKALAVQWLAEWTPRFRTVAGVRRETTDHRYDEYGADPAVIGFDPFLEETLGQKSRAYRLGASFDLLEDLSLFSTLGYGSFAQSAIARDGSTISDPRKVSNIELGLKWTFAGGKALASASVYRLRESNLLTPDCLPTEPACHAQKLVGGRRIEGVELDIRGGVARDLQVGAGVALQNARIIESPSGFSGNRFANTPRVQVSAFASYGLAAWGLAPLQLNAGLVHLGGRYGNAGNTAPLPGYTLVNLGARWAFSPATSLQLDVSNLLDKTWYTSMQDNDSSASDQVGIGDRRLIQLTLNHRF